MTSCPAATSPSRTYAPTVPLAPVSTTRINRPSPTASIPAPPRRRESTAGETDDRARAPGRERPGGGASALSGGGDVDGASRTAAGRPDPRPEPEPARPARRVHGR